jgi:hypothetical protein
LSPAPCGERYSLARFVSNSDDEALGSAPPISAVAFLDDLQVVAGIVQHLKCEEQRLTRHDFGFIGNQAGIQLNIADLGFRGRGHFRSKKNLVAQHVKDKNREEDVTGVEVMARTAQLGRLRA